MSLVAVQIRVVHAVDLARCALDHGVALVAVAVGFEDVDLHRLFVARAAEEGHRLFAAVTIEVDHLHALQIAARRGRGILRAVCEQRVDLRFERLILARELRQAVERRLRCREHAARKQQ